ncbi:hypothetical protein ACFYSC_04580 [Streptosporangium sp. NPDC004379]|uniref:hypothetical protein n=1 Tax=Streptosporangium sp. NPDC004379 TaxID=3366189 RepID=UPI0036C5EC01
MGGYVRWKDVRAEHVRRAGGEEAVRAGKRELLAEVREYAARREKAEEDPPVPSVAEGPAGSSPGR